MSFLNYRIYNLPVKTYIKRITVGVAAGWGCGECIRNMRQHPGSAQNFMKYAAAGGFVGGLRGYFIGVWMGYGAISLFLSQSMMMSCVTFGFFSIRSAISNEKFIFPWRKEPISEMLVTSFSTGITMASFSMFTGVHPKRMLSNLSLGIVFGFIGHLAYVQARRLRLELLLKKNHPELIAQLKDAEEYMDYQQYSNPSYRGPVRPTPWTDWARQVWDDFGRNIGNDNNVEDTTSA